MPERLPRYLDGPRFVAFLSSEGVTRADLTESQKRRYYEWERGARADLYSDSVDRLVTDHRLLALIPDNCWATDQNHHKPQKGEPLPSHPSRTLETA